MRKDQEYKKAALNVLKGNWAPAIVMSIIIFALVSLLVSPSVIAFVSPSAFSKIGTGGMCCAMGIICLMIFFVLLPFSAGYMVSCMHLYTEGDAKLIGNMFKATFSDFFRIAGAMFLVYIAVLLGSLLIVPGFILICGLSMTPYILEDEPQLSAFQAIKRSWNMMKGHKKELFILHLSFIGWFLLIILTLGIASVWAMPYLSTAQAAFYRDIVQ